MRLDKFLKVSRIVKRRTVANEMCDAGKVSINDRIAKASTEVKVGDIIEMKFGASITKFEVLGIKEHVRKEETSEMFRMI
ncbi:MAG: RNA-binding S4 domain-containing protein [Ignavibacteriales bacterium]